MRREMTGEGGDDGAAAPRPGGGSDTYIRAVLLFLMNSGARFMSLSPVSSKLRLAGPADSAI